MAVTMSSNCRRCETPPQIPPPAAAGVHCTMCRRSVATAVVATEFHSTVSRRYVPTTGVHCNMCRWSTTAAYPSPSQPVIHGGGSQKRAVICGILYKNTEYRLQGCINDAKHMKYLLVHHFRFPETSVLVLTDEETDINKRPTKENIRKALRWLMEGVRAGDSLVFHFSGHGFRLEDFNDDEFIGYKKMLCPLDYVIEGTITSAEINATIVRPLPTGAKLLAIIDSCYSGTMLDLPSLCRMKRNGHYEWEDHRPPTGANNGTNGGEVICFSACDENQLADETRDLSKVVTTGAMTFAFIEAIESGRAHSYGELLNSIRAIIQNPDDCSEKSSLDELSTGSFPENRIQEPQLTANAPFDVYRKPFSL